MNGRLEAVGKAAEDVRGHLGWKVADVGGFEAAFELAVRTA
jgi:hypothetical protein